MERKLRRRVHEALLQDRGIRDGSGGEDKANDGSAYRVRERFEHPLEAVRRSARTRVTTDLGGDLGAQRPKDQGAAPRGALPAHVADPGSEAFPTLNALDPGQIAPIDDRAPVRAQVPFDRPLQM